MLSRAVRMSLLDVSSERTESASITETPARMKTASWRHRCIRSRFLTFFLVISRLRMDFFSAMEIGCRLRSSSSSRTMLTPGDFSTPVTTDPSTAAALKRNLGTVSRTSQSQGVDASDDFGDGRHVLGDEGEALAAEGPHPLVDRHAPELVLGRPADQETPDLRRHLEELVDADTVLVARVRAEVAPPAPVEHGLALPAALLVEGDLLLGGLVGLLARSADPPDQPLAHHRQDRGGDEEGLHSHVEQAVKGRDRVGGVQGGHDEVPGERRLDGYAGRLLVADLAHEDHVGILTEDRPEAVGEGDPRLVVGLDLVDRGEDVLHGVLDGDDVAGTLVDLGHG